MIQIVNFYLKNFSFWFQFNSDNLLLNIIKTASPYTTDGLYKKLQPARNNRAG